jgi:hypothetical protein
MAVASYKVDFFLKYFGLDGRPLPSPPTLPQSGSAFAYGANIFLSASHIFDHVERSNTLFVDVRAKASDPKLYVEQNSPGVAIDSMAHLRGYDALAAFNNIGTSQPTNDLCYVTAKVDVPTSALSPVVVFADQQSMTGSLQDRAIARTGSASAPSSGAFDGWKAPGEFGARTPARKGDSGGPASVDLDGVSHTVGVLSTTYVSSFYGDSARYSYLDPKAYALLDKAVVANGATKQSYSGMAPDLIVGGSADGLKLKGGVRPVSIVLDGDDATALAGTGAASINTGLGSGATLFASGAVGEDGAGTQFVISPGHEAIVGGGPNDRLVLLADRLWSETRGAPTADAMTRSGARQATATLH